MFHLLVFFSFLILNNSHMIMLDTGHVGTNYIRVEQKKFENSHRTWPLLILLFHILVLFIAYSSLLLSFLFFI